MEENKEVKEQIEETKDMQKNVIDITEKYIEELLKEEITKDNLDVLYKLIDIHKDICNEKYWKIKESEIMRYNDGYGNYGNYGNYGEYNGYGNYSGRRAGYDSYGNNYGEYGRGNYGRRGRDIKYRGDDELDRMSGEYGRYQESRSRYGAGEETDKSFHYMVEAYKDFTKVLFEEAETPQQKQMLREAIQQSMM